MFDTRSGNGHCVGMGSLADRLGRAVFTALALAIAGLPLLGLARRNGLRLGTVPEWIAALALVWIAAGVWHLARRDARTRIDA